MFIMPRNFSSGKAVGSRLLTCCQQVGSEVLNLRGHGCGHCSGVCGDGGIAGDGCREFAGGLAHQVQVRLGGLADSQCVDVALGEDHMQRAALRVAHSCSFEGLGLGLGLGLKLGFRIVAHSCGGSGGISVIPDVARASNSRQVTNKKTAQWLAPAMP